MESFKKVLFWLCITLAILHVIRYLFYGEDWLTAMLGFVSMTLISINLYFSKDKK
jgi:magnesium-transporting ATPase (P-type)